MSLSVLQPEELDWEEWRQQGIGSSDAPGIAGVSPWSSPISVWLNKVGLAASSEPSEAMKWGLLLEPVIIKEFEDRTGWHVRGRQTRVTHAEHKWMRATLDGLLADSSDPEVEPFAVYEGKTAGDWGRADWANGVPLHYQVQVTHQLAVTGKPAGWVVALLGGQKLVSFLVERDEEAIDLLIDLEQTFWTKYVLTQTPPPMDGSDRTTEAIRDAFTEPSPLNVVELPAEAVQLVREIHAADIEERAAKESAEAARNTIRLLLGDHEIGLYAGEPLATWKQVTQDRLDVDALRAVDPVIAARFTKTTTHRRLLFPKHQEVGV